LFLAARDSCVPCIPILADAGADVNATEPDGYTPIMFAIINGQYDAAAALLDKGANPNLAHKSGSTALYAAVDFHTMPDSNRPSPKETDNRISSLDLIKMLLAKGANVNAQLSRQIPYRTKLDRGDDTMLGAGTTPFLRAAKAADVVVMKLLLENGADPTLARKVNPLMAAAGIGTKEEDTTGRRKTQAEIIEAKGSPVLLAPAGGNHEWRWCHGADVSGKPRDPVCKQLGVFQHRLPRAIHVEPQLDRGAKRLVENLLRAGMFAVGRSNADNQGCIAGQGCSAAFEEGARSYPECQTEKGTGMQATGRGRCGSHQAACGADVPARRSGPVTLPSSAQ
jgi:hypothetical protein